MARTITEIQSAIAESLLSKFPNLSQSAVAEWRLLAHCVAVAIHLFEVILDKFKAETEDKIKLMAPGTLRWYAEMSRRFQNGHALEFDTKTAKYYYPTIDPASQIISVAAVSVGESGQLAIKVAKTVEDGAMMPLSEDELVNFNAYINAIKIIGTKCSVISSSPDLIQYALIVAYDPAYLAASVEKQIKEALQLFKSSIGFNGMFYSLNLLDAILHCDGVLTMTPYYIRRKGATDSDYEDVDLLAELHAGYFNYSDDSIFMLGPLPNGI